MIQTPLNCQSSRKPVFPSPFVQSGSELWMLYNKYIIAANKSALHGSTRFLLITQRYNTPIWRGVANSLSLLTHSISLSTLLSVPVAGAVRKMSTSICNFLVYFSWQKTAMKLIPFTPPTWLTPVLSRRFVTTHLLSDWPMRGSISAHPQARSPSNGRSTKSRQ